MKITLLSGESFDVPIDPIDLWSVYKLVRDGHLEAIISCPPRVENVRKIDHSATFGEAILAAHEDTIPPPEMAVIHDDPK